MDMLSKCTVCELNIPEVNYFMDIISPDGQVAEKVCNQCKDVFFPPLKNPHNHSSWRYHHHSTNSDSENEEEMNDEDDDDFDVRRKSRLISCGKNVSYDTDALSDLLARSPIMDTSLPPPTPPNNILNAENLGSIGGQHKHPLINASSTPLPILKLDSMEPGADLFCTAENSGTAAAAVPVKKLTTGESTNQLNINLIYENSLTCIPPPSNFAHKLQILHSERINNSGLNYSDFAEYYLYLDRRFRTFASNHPSFQRLSHFDQQILLSSNSPIYFQYHMAKYIQGTTGYQQLSSLLLPHDFPEMELIPVSFRFFNDAVRLFKESVYTEFYESMAFNAAGNKARIPEMDGYLCASFLFYADKDTNECLESPGFIFKEFKKSLDLIEHCRSKSPILTQLNKKTPEDINALVKTRHKSENLTVINDTKSQNIILCENLKKMVHFYTNHVTATSNSRTSVKQLRASSSSPSLTALVQTNFTNGLNS